MVIVRQKNEVSQLKKTLADYPQKGKDMNNVLDAPTKEDIREDEKRLQEMILSCETAENNFRKAIVEMLDSCRTLESMKAILDEEYLRFPGVKSVY